MIKHLSLKAYGKINLGLDVLRRRDDGYHEVRMIMQTVGIFDRIDLIREEQPGIRIETNLFYLPTNENNLVYKAAQMLMEEFSISEGVSIHLRKFIPVSAGMAGGSSDAAAILFGVNKMFHLGLTTRQLMERGVKIGADVPYCILRGTALSEGIGEILTPLPAAPQCQVLIAKPGVSVSTRSVYTNLHANQLRPEQHPDIDGILAGIRSQDIAQIASKLGNVLETVTVREYPVIQAIKDKMLAYGADGALMSGSGPTVFGLFTDPASAKRAFEELRSGPSSKLAKQVYLTNFYNTKNAPSSEF
jgi:4-diphosphocytidyl-2C-methyl-D-erythritol kinase